MCAKLNEGSFTPLYQQLMEDIKAAIEGGKYKYDEKIPSEPELSELYSVSRITVRRAIDELCSEGYLSKKQGKGTYVNKPKMQRKIERPRDVLGFTDSTKLNGMTPGTRVLGSQVVKARSDETKFFEIGEGEQVLYVQRLRTADGQPIMLENNFFPYEQCKGLESKLVSGQPLFDTFKTECGSKSFASERCTLEIVRANEETAELLEVPLGEPLFYMNAYFTDENNTPLFIGRQFIVGSRYMFHI